MAQYGVLDVHPRSSGHSPFAEACEELYHRLAKFAAISGGRVLEVGCGCGDFLPFWASQYGAKEVLGITSLRAHVERARDTIEACDGELKQKVTVIEGDAVKALEGMGEEGKWDVVVAADCVYHFSTRAAFLARAHALLKPGATLALTDLVLPPSRSFTTRLLQRLLCFLTSAPHSNFLTLPYYTASISNAGFTDIEVEDITEHVFEGLAEYIQMRTHEGKEGVVARANGGLGGDWLGFRVFAKVLSWWLEGRMLFVLVRAKKGGVKAESS